MCHYDTKWDTQMSMNCTIKWNCTHQVQELHLEELLLHINNCSVWPLMWIMDILWIMDIQSHPSVHQLFRGMFLMILTQFLVYISIFEVLHSYGIRKFIHFSAKFSSSVPSSHLFNVNPNIDIDDDSMVSDEFISEKNDKNLKLSSSMSSSPVILNNINVDRGRVQKRIESPSVASNGQSSTHFYSQKTFYDLKISKYVETVVNAFSLSRPSKIQALSYQTIANGTSCVLADQTGSGKTLAYLLPLIQQLYTNPSSLSTSLAPSMREIEGKSSRMLNSKRRQPDIKKVLHPRVLIMAPTAELASQVSQVVKSISSILRFRSLTLTSTSSSVQDEIASYPVMKLSSNQTSKRSKDDIVPIEVLVATPGRLFSSLKNGDISLGMTTNIVLDEADVLFLDESFPLQGIGSYLPETVTIPGSSIPAIPTQFIFVTATLPDVILKQISREFPEAVTLKGPGLHRIPPTVEEILVDCSVQEQGLRGKASTPSQQAYSEAVLENKRLCLLNALTLNSDVERTIVFCNTIETCRFVENALLRSDRNSQVRKALGYHSAIDPKRRLENLNEFTRKLLPSPVILICTDRASRGIDFASYNVDHVILFDFPQEPSEYVRRVGRTGRAGRFGKVTILAHGRQVAMVKSLLSASKQGKRIDPIPSMSSLASYSKKDDLDE